MAHEIPSIDVQARDHLGSRYAARLRKQGRLPVVVYGRKKDPVHLTVDRKEMVGLLHRNAHLLQVSVDGAAEPCLIKDVQWNHLGNEVVHVDLARVDLTQKVKVDVPLEFVGEAIGLKTAGAILERPLTELEIECLATQIPDSIRVDISGLQVDDMLTVAGLKMPEGVTAMADPDTVVASIHVMAEEVAEVTPAEEGAAEPELIRKPTDDEDGAVEKK